jgi:hypothetical protein
MRLKEYFDIINSDRPDRHKYYIATALAEEVFPEVAGEIGRPSYIPEDRFTRKIERPTVWVGSDNYTQLHYHPGTEVISSQVLGRKHFTLFPPSEQPRLYPNPWWSNRFNWSQVNYFRYDEQHEKFPELAHARRYECVLEPGEQIYIPPYWWHAVHNEGPAILITAFWKSRTKMSLFKSQGIGTAFWPIMRSVKTLVLRRSHTD